MQTDAIAALISGSLTDAHVDVRSDDGTHFAALIVSPDFEGLNPIKRHQLVYRALGDRVGNEIHALSIRALTPAEAQRAAGES